ncbi:MAG: glycine dehydrogenase subunit 2 [Dehalococcoidia bacterium]|nr:glycine dehydrogenase subunit 2 [Dehalococcoidia bacterium]
MDRSVPGRVGTQLPALDVPAQPLPPAALLRHDLPLPELSELDVVRYFTRLSQKNFSVDTNFYPLGSCTMKYNPKVNDTVAAFPGFAALHPLQPEETVQGALELLYRLQDMLQEVTGMAGCSLATLAGAHGELAGVLMMRAYHLAQGDTKRKVILIPDSAHGTNPASAAMAGFRVASIPSDAKGNMDLHALRNAANDELAGLMITLPSTLGLFDTGIQEVCSIVHEAGGLVYGDGANMNALLGRVKLGALGFDVVHLNLHKTFSTPHGGGGPGAGPVCAAERLAPFLPTPVIERVPPAAVPAREDTVTYRLGAPGRSIGRMAAFHGNFGVLVRAYAYSRALGADGLRQVSGDAVLAANYVLASLKDLYHLPYDRRCMHEVVFSAKRQKERGVRALDVAKRLLDYGIHAPTMYFPLIVDEALMIEPTEAESKETLDRFIQVMRHIAQEAVTSPETVTGAPSSAPISRLDEARAARHPDLRWKPRTS